MTIKSEPAIVKPLTATILALLAALVAAPAAAPKPTAVDISKLPAPAKGAVDFAKDIQPMLAKRCYSCHGAEKQKAGLRLDLKAHALSGGDSGKVIVPGKSAESKLVHLVAGLDKDSVMPPKGDKLTAKQIGLLRAWIDDGANWPDQLPTANAQLPSSQHWAFKAPVRAALPKVKEPKWVRNAIDNFVLARLEKEKVKPSPEADRFTLIRRLSLDLLGLPPTPEQVAEFIADQRADAYEQLVERLLASPHFGERWGRQWLDLARYADSDGYEKDRPRPFAYLYRNWVIDAINRDLPFDQFTIEQLAGDLLPHATHEQKVATGFHRQTLTNTEGGTDQEEFRCKATVDRVSTTATVWLGLTAACAECHTHKYDPLTQREFYSFFAFFNNASEKDIPAPQPDELAAYESAKKTWDTAQNKIKLAHAAYVKSDLTTAHAKWEQTVKLPSTRWTVLEPKKAVSQAGVALKVQKDRSLEATGKSADKDTYTVEVETELKGITGFRLEVLPGTGKAKAVGHSKTNNFVLSEFTVSIGTATNQAAKSPPEKKRGKPVAKPVAPQPEGAVALQNATADFSQKGFAIAGAVDASEQTGWGVAPQVEQRHVAAFETKEPLSVPAGERLTFRLDQQHGADHTLAHFRLSATTSPPPLAADLMPDAVVAALEQPAAARHRTQQDEVDKYYREDVDPTLRKFAEQLSEHAKQEPKFPATKAATLVAEATGRKTQVHIRGNFMDKGDEVQPGVFAVLSPLKARGEQPDRLDLAQWLMAPEHPLTGRVTVNHAWKMLLGRGLVATMNDFGTRGERPSHPELLDWLATEFPRLGWSRKALVKLIVTSATYRQASVIRPELQARDPNNVLLARQNRFRLEAENVRDIYLAASGLLNPAIGGPSIRPPLPADIAALGYANSVKWTESTGAEKYRRGLYIFFQRTVPYPMLMTFDAPDSNTTCTRRERSNTPLQALALLNDPVFFECAQSLGQRAAQEPGATDEKIKRAFQRAVARAPGREELARLLQLYSDQMRLLAAAPESAAKILGSPKTAPADAAARATMVALSRIILNLDEFVTRE